jgi:hypothetical protein
MSEKWVYALVGVAIGYFALPMALSFVGLGGKKS